MDIIRDKILREKFMCSSVLNKFSRGNFRKDHPQQRKAQQWDNEIRDGFIATVIKNEDFDSIKICEQVGENGVDLWLIDGMQRLTTLELYKKGMFKLGRYVEFPIVKYQAYKMDEKGMPMLDENGAGIYEVLECDLRGKGYSDLPTELQEMFDNCPIDIVKRLDCSNEEVGYSIRRYNRSVKMNTSQSAITYMDDTARKIKDLSSHSFFEDCANFTSNQIKKNVVDKAVCETIMALFFFNNWTKQAKKIGMFINEHATPEMFEITESYLDRLSEIVNDDTKVLFTNKDMLLWMMLFQKFDQYGVDDEVFGEFLDEFINNLHGQEILETSWDELDSFRNTKDRGILTDKLCVLEALMLDFMGLDKIESGDECQNDNGEDEENGVNITNNTTDVDSSERLGQSDNWDWEEQTA